MLRQMARLGRLILTSVFAGGLGHGMGVPSSAAFAAQGSAEQDAEEHIQKGIDLRRLNKDAEALAEFEKALALVPSVRAKGQRRLAEMALGRFEVAEVSLAEVVDASEDAWVKAHRKVLLEALERTRAQLGTLKVSGEPAGAKVQVNGKDRCTLPCSVHVQAGEVAVRVLSPGFLPILRTVVVSAREISSQEFNLVSTGVVSAGDSPPRAIRAVKSAEPEAKEGSPWPWVAGGAGILAAGFGVYEAVQWSHKASDFNSRKDANGNLICGNSDPGAGGPGCMDLLNDGQRARLLAIGGLTVGAGLGVLSWVLFSRESAGDAGASQAERSQTLSCSPALGHASVVCSARF